MKGYQYVLLRLVPRVDREEFINVGVVLYCQDADFLDAAWELDPARAAALAPTCDLDGVRAMLERVRAVCRGETGRGLPSPRQAGPALRLDHRAPLDGGAAGAGPRRPLRRPGG